MNYFHAYTAADITSLVRLRAGETKLGERLVVDASVWQESCRFVLCGIKEDVGVRANLGVGGTGSAWESFLSAFVNIQSTQVLTGNEMQLAGYFDFTGFASLSTPEECRKAMEIIDVHITDWVTACTKANKIPILVGGSHANAYSAIRGAAQGYFQQGILSEASLHSINLDAHTDFRAKEGRHSGNGFRYAYEEGYLKKYAVLGLHENYNAQTILTELAANPDVWVCFWEDIFLREKYSFHDAIQQAIDFIQGKLTGIELDMDCIENVLSSAMTPSGISTTQARQYLHHTAMQCRVAYLHICEGATQLANGLTSTHTGKLISYLVSDFVKAHNCRGE